PTLIELGDNPWCICGSGIEEAGDLLEKLCIVYGMKSAFQTNIQLHSCLKCRNQYIGPECREIGLLNLNNRSLFTHGLLEHYTTTFTSSETPMAAFTTDTAQTYMSSGNGIPFVSNATFCAAWFAYADLVVLENDMVCEICGLSPKEVIFNGVSISFSHKQIQDTIKPPTTI
ncbi:hypothetical protein BDQ17DRAFT_1194969, partial [Cyathus striatus]